MNWKDLPWCDGAWDVDLNTMHANCSKPFNPNIVLIVAALLFVILFVWFLRRKQMQAKFTLSFPIAGAPLAAADLTFPGVVGQPEAGSMQISGGTPPYSVAVDDPATLPPGVTVDTQGNVSGTPTAAGTFSVPVTVNDSSAG